MSNWFTSLSLFEQIAFCYLIFMAGFAAYLYFEIKRSKVYLDEDMRDRVE